MIESKINDYKNDTIIYFIIGILLFIVFTQMAIDLIPYMLYTGTIDRYYLFICFSYFGLLVVFYSGIKLIQYISGKVFLELIKINENVVEIEEE